MVARVLAFLGVPMGVPVPAPVELVNYEDPEFVRILHVDFNSDASKAKLGALVQERNSTYPLWGFKLPMALNSLRLLNGALRNPYFIFVFRDPLAIALRESIAVDLPLLSGLVNVANYYSSLSEFLTWTTAPCLLISYEKAVQHPNLFCDELVHFLHLNLSPRDVKIASEQIRPSHPEYLSRVVTARSELGLAPLHRSAPQANFA